MGFFKNIIDKLKGNKPNDSFPITIELIPEKLSVIVDEHKIPVTMGNNNIRALSFLSNGLSNVGQQELFFVLKTNQIDVNNTPQEPLHFFEQVYEIKILLTAGNDVDLHLTEFGITNVPEPSTVAIFGLALVGFAFSSRRKAK